MSGKKKAIKLSLHIICIFWGNCFCVLFLSFLCILGLLYFLCVCVWFYEKRLKTEVGAKYVFLFPLEFKEYICTGRWAWASQAQRFNIKAIWCTTRQTRNLPLQFCLPFVTHVLKCGTRCGWCGKLKRYPLEEARNMELLVR